MKKRLSAGQTKELLEIVKARFDNHLHRHKGIVWSEVEARLVSMPDKMWSLNEMETTGGEPDVIGYDKKKDAFVFCDCSAESPSGRRSLCYDTEALKSRKEHKPKNSALAKAAEMGIELLTEEQYRTLQEIESIDSKTSSWLMTPGSVRKLGGALFGDHRFGRVFVYHNGAESYYAARGFRGILCI
ncbi:MAG: hypothetical protein OJF59_001852 [Cytophagales bacterium]|jgi:hypothetical protein|nr:DUF4256 domain-containing protein [Bacteroidota bacterium]MBS1980761.1 DUF4256 domain-containing protein [Bacteroidota bacterium]WHZ08099.1 MAG: hypothetical protein OJF59_001852 [Cytophagales bacterium]